MSEQPEHEEARRLETAEAYARRAKSIRSASFTDALAVAENVDGLLALLSKAEQERDDLERQQDRDVERILKLQRELERLREAICAEAHHFPPGAVAGTSCYCGKAAW